MSDGPEKMIVNTMTESYFIPGKDASDIDSNLDITWSQYKKTLEAYF